MRRLATLLNCVISLTQAAVLRTLDRPLPPVLNSRRRRGIYHQNPYVKMRGDNDTYWKGHNLIQFAAFKKHIGVYPGPEAVEKFADRLMEYKTSKGAIQFPYEKPMPLEFIAEIAKWCETGD